MLLKTLSFFSPIDNIAFDEALLLTAQQQGDPSLEYLRLWESQSVFIVLGQAGKINEEIYLENAQLDRIPVLRRCSGGGTVIQGQGCLNYAFVLSKQKDPRVADLHQSYRVVLDHVVEILRSLSLRVEFQPISDLVIEPEDKKISGNAQKRTRNYILHHGTLLYDFDLSLMERYLKVPAVAPKYRQGRAHQDFVANLGAAKDQIQQAFMDYFQPQVEEEVLTEKEKQALEVIKSRNKRIVASEGL